MRIKSSKQLQPSAQLDVGYNSYYIAGATSRQIYLGNRSAVRHLLISGTNLRDTQHVKLSIEGVMGLQFRSIKVKVDSPYFYFVDGSIPAIFRGRLGDWSARRYTYDSAYFENLVPIGNRSFALTTTSGQTRESTLGKETNVQPYLRLVPGLLEKQIDGKFCVDGMIHYSRNLNWIVYVYYYRNQFICMDSSLNLIYRGNTIDTVSKAKIQIAKITSEHSVTMAAPPLMVNPKSCIESSRLYINSNLLAKNDDINMFKSSYVIDVYELNNGQYLSSIYLPKFKGQKLHEFKVFDNTLIALYDHWVVKFLLDTTAL